MKKTSLRNRLIRVFILTSMLPIIILGVFSYISMSVTLSRNTEMMSKSSLKQLDNNLNISLEAYEDVLYQLYTDDNMVKWVFEIDEGTNEAVAVNQMRRFMSSLLYTKDYIRAVSVITPGGELITYEQMTPATYKSSWLDNFSKTQNELYEDIEQDNKVHLYPTEFGTNFANKDYYLFHMAHRIIDYKSLTKDCGVVIVSVDEDFLKDICLNSSDDTRIFNFIVDDKGQIVTFGDESEIIGKSVTDMSESEEQRLSDYDLFLKKNYPQLAREAAVFVMHDEKLSWDVVNVTSLSELTRLQRRQLVLVAIIGVLAMTLVVLMSTGLSANLVKSVHYVTGRMKQARNGDLSVRAEKDKAMPAEIETIADAFNDMMKKLNVALTKQQEAQIAALEAQINPHFLYNTLDTINWMAIDKDEYDISNAISALANILRYAIVNSNGEVTIRDEMEWLRKYIYLQQYRVKNSFSYNAFVEPDAQTAIVHKLLLQPFIENAIKHGFTPDQEDARLGVYVGCKDDFLQISIEDNGKGMAPDIIEKINSRDFETLKGNTNIGISNVVTRLEMYYGNEGKMRAEPGREKGSLIIIEIPLKKKTD
ncbi:cache domain-containing sensor histidine kinase [Butyrivibrio sp. VCB2001]|uniref:cache domain-containing sensor histidine kinase n=1 Tax=Butyrivibrio sp. VCB2001 TaxID=1280667 RepID=UPI00047C3757|nr:sensor histidine kinase [Butyrivibrio sp. VCB2001]